MAGQTPNYERFIADLGKPDVQLHPLYVISGDELLLRNEALDALRAACRLQGYTERVTLSLTATGPWNAIEENTQSISLFGDRKLMELELPTGKPGKTGGDALVSLANRAARQELTDISVALILPRADRTISSAKWYTAVTQHAVLVNTPIISREQLPAWIQGRLKRQKQHADPATLAWITDKVEGNLLAAHQEILKLGLQYPEGELTLEEVESAVLDVSRYNVFDMSHAILRGDGQRALKVLHGLQAEGEALPMVLGLLTYDIRNLYTLAQARQNGHNPRNLTRKLGLFPPKDQLILNTLDRLPFSQIMGLIQHAHDIDRLFKGFPADGRLTDAWQEMARLVLRMADTTASSH